MRPFHLAFPVLDIEETRRFYVDLLGSSVGRESDKWIDLDFFGHQISAHVKPEEVVTVQTNPVDGKQVPVRHFGVVLEWGQWQSLAERLKAAKIDFIIEPYVRFEGEVGEQATMFFLDPCGNALEFKAFKDDRQLFAA
ncbi:VOC family protein [Rhodovibrionaceae bacterium A322]